MTAFHLLESRLLLEIYNMRLVLSQILHPEFTHIQHNQFMFPHVNLSPTLYHNIDPPPPKEEPTTKSTTVRPDTTTSHSIVFPSTTEKAFTFSFKNLDSTTPKSHPTSHITSANPLRIPTVTTESVQRTTSRPNNLFPFLKSLPVTRRFGPRDFEVYKFNNTILSGNEVQVFTYFWKIENYTQSVVKNSTELISPAFVISGFNLRIKATLNYLHRDYLYLRLEEMPKDYTSASSVILETGDDLFQEIEKAEMFRYKILVLDQSPTKSDLISQEFTDTTSGFMIPSSALTSTTDTYIKDNLILIKVILYL